MKHSESSYGSQELESKDSRLRHIINLDSRGKFNFYDISKYIKREARIDTTTYMKSLSRDWRYHIMYKNASIASVMDAMANLGRHIWRRLEKINLQIPDYELDYEKDHMINLYKPSDRVEQWSEKATAFVEYISNLSESAKNEIFHGKLLQLSQLPDDAQRGITSALQSVSGGKKNQSDITKAGDIALKIDNKSLKSSEFLSIFVTMSGSEFGSYGFTLSNFTSQQRKAGLSGGKFLSQEADRYPYTYIVNCGDEDNFTDYDSAKKIKILQKNLSINTRNATIEELMRLFFKNFGLNIISDIDDSPKLYMIDAKNIPLWTAMDVVCDRMGGWQWEYRKDGFVVFRHPRNSRRRTHGLNVK